jgi:hypothetical protein
MATYADFWSGMLTAMGLPDTIENQAALNTMVFEEGANTYYNPSNIEYHSGDNPVLQGVGNWNSVGVQEYGSFDAGVKAASTFFGQQHWQGVVAALKNGHDYNGVVNAIAQAYTWAYYNNGRVPIEQSQARLSASMGSSVPTTGTVPSTPNATPLPNANTGGTGSDNAGAFTAANIGALGIPGIPSIPGVPDSLGSGGLVGGLLPSVPLNPLNWFSSISGGIKDTKDALTAIGGMMGTMSNFFADLIWIFKPSNFIKAMLYAGGFLLVATGFWLMATGTGTERPT